MKKSRQAAQKNDDNKRKLFLFYSVEQLFGFIFLLIVVATSIWIIDTVKDWMGDPERVVLSQLTLTGDKDYTTEDEVRKAIMGLGLPNTYIAQDVDDIQREIMRLSWVKLVSVRKQWPDRLIVHITEYHPQYFWNDIFLLDEDANVFNLPSNVMNNLDLPHLYGPEAKEAFVLDGYKKLDYISQKLANNNLKLQIKSASADERNSWQLIVIQCIAGFCIENQDIRLMLGREHIEQRYERFIKLFAEIQQRTPKNERIIAADLRYENGISVQKEKIESEAEIEIKTEIN